MSKNMLGIMAGFLALTGQSLFPEDDRPKMTDEELEAEYELIQQKKSKLSASQREGIVWLVERKRAKRIVLDNSSKL